MNKRIAGLLAASLVMGSSSAPTAFASGTQRINQYRSSIVLDGIAQSHPSEIVAFDGTTKTAYMPLFYINQALSKVGVKATWNGTTHTWSLTAPNSSLDAGASLGTGNTSVLVNGKLVRKINTIAVKDSSAGKNTISTTYAPIYYIMTLLNSMGVENKWNGLNHSWIETSPVTVSTKNTTYGSVSKTTTLSKNLVISATGVTVRNLKVVGNVIINPGANGSVTLDTVSATGSIVVLSGANHSIHLKNVHSPTLEVHSTSAVHIVSEGTTSISVTVIPSGDKQGVTLDQQGGSLGSVTVGSTATVTLTGSQPFKQLDVTGKGSVQISSGATVVTLNITGSGTKVTIATGSMVTTLNLGQVASVDIKNDGTVKVLTNDSTSSGVTVTGNGKVSKVNGNTPTGLQPGGGTTPPGGGTTPPGGGITPPGGGTTPPGGGTTPPGGGTGTPVTPVDLVALGDSITYGYNLGANNNSVSKYAFPEVMAGTDGLSVQDLAHPGYTSVDLLKQIQNNTDNVQAYLKSAKYVTLDIGSNDLLGQATSIIQKIAANPGYVPSPTEQTTLTAALTTATHNFATTLPQIITQIRSYTNAPIVLYNLYDPFPAGFLHSVGEQVIPTMNQVIAASTSTTNKISLADAYHAFNGNQVNLVRILEGDVHPTIEGQIVLAQLGEQELGLSTITPDPYAAQDAALAKTLSELGTLHTALAQTGGLSAVQTAESKVQNLSATDWTNILYGNTNPPSNAGTLASLIKQIVPLLTYTHFSDDLSATTTVAQIVMAIQHVDPSITAADIYSLVVNAEQSFTLVGTSSSPGAMLISGLQNAVDNTPGVAGNYPFKGLLQQYGLSSADLAAIELRAKAQIDPTNATENAILKAIGFIELEKVHAALAANPAALAAVQTAEANLKKVDWKSILWPNGSTTVSPTDQTNIVTVFQNVFGLVSYGALTENTSPTLSAIGQALRSLDPSITRADTVTFVRNLPSDLLASAIMSSSASEMLAAALQADAATTQDANGTHPFEQFLTQYGLDIPSIMTQIQTVPGVKDAELALIKAMGSIYFEPQPTQLAVGHGTPYSLILSPTVFGASSGISIPPSLITWTVDTTQQSTGTVEIDKDAATGVTTVKGLSAGTVYLVASVHGYQVYELKVVVQ